MTRKTKRTIIFDYKKHNSLQDFLCFYCGQYADTKDHVPPVCYAEHLSEQKKWLVRACRQCNTLLGSRAYVTFLARAEYLAKAYAKKFKRTLAMPTWSEKEIEELRGGLRRRIFSGQKRKIFIQEKIDFIERNIAIFMENIESKLIELN